MYFQHITDITHGNNSSVDCVLLWEQQKASLIWKVAFLSIGPVVWADLYSDLAIHAYSVRPVALWGLCLVPGCAYL